MNTLNMSEAELDEYRERVAILEFEAGYSRARAEALALQMILRKRTTLNAAKVAAEQAEKT